MLLSRMCRENPDHIGLFVVHRIPLVFQQAEAIRADTGLRVIGICGENITRHKINQVVSRGSNLPVKRWSLKSDSKFLKNVVV